MKRIFVTLLLLSAGAIFLVSGCATIPLSQTKNISSIAVVEISAPSVVAWPEGSEKRGVLSGIQEAVKGAEAVGKGEDIVEVGEEMGYSTQNVLNDSVDIVFKNLQESVPFRVLSKDEVIGNSYYQSLKEEDKSGVVRALEKLGENNAEGFKSIFTWDPKKDSEVIEKLTEALDVDTLILTYIEFQKRLSAGVGATGAIQGVVNFQARAGDRSGKVLWSKEYTAYSDKAVPIVGGVYDYDELDKLLLQALDKASDWVFTH